MGIEWYTADQLSGLPKLPSTARRIRSRADSESWLSRKRLKGKGFEFHISSLPQETQAHLLIINGYSTPQTSSHSDAALPTPSSDEATRTATQHQDDEGVSFYYDKESLWENYARKSNKQKAAAEKKLIAINAALTMMENGTPATKSWKAAAAQAEVHFMTLRDRWFERIEQYDRTDWLAALVPGYVGRQAISECDLDAWEFFKADYLRLEKPTANACYRRLKRAAVEQNWTVPSVDTLLRRIKRDIPTTIVILKREGEQALMRLYPSQQRTVRELHALEWINGDGYQHNVFVKWPDGSIDRPKTWFWQDIYSRKILSYRIDITENTDSIRLSFGDLVETYGIPEDATIDNTRAAANKWMTGGVPNRYRFKVKEDDPLGLFPTLGVKVHWTSVYNGRGHGQAKPIERAFGVGGIGEVIDKHPAFVGAYTGHNTTAKPENYGSHAVPLEDFIAIVEQEIIEWNAQDKRRTEMAAGQKSFDQVFADSYERAPIRKATEQQRALWLLSAEAITVQREGTVTLDAGSSVGVGRNRYKSPGLYEHVGKKVVIRFDPQKLHNDVFIYTLDGQFIDRGVCIDDAGFGDTQAAREHSRARKQFMRATKTASQAQTKMDAVAVAGLLPSSEKTDIPESKVVRPFKPITSREQPKPRQMSEREQVIFEQMQSGELDNVFTIPQSDPEKHRAWLALNERQSAGEILTEDELSFHVAWTSSRFYKANLEVEEDLAVKAN
ncbi:MAG: DNA-binding protein [Gammaproteobacteria bacterium]|nr:DNA-binding protein [Gammaproteobacteria bacterium]